MVKPRDGLLAPLFGISHPGHGPTVGPPAEPGGEGTQTHVVAGSSAPLVGPPSSSGPREENSGWISAVNFSHFLYSDFTDLSNNGRKVRLLVRLTTP